MPSRSSTLGVGGGNIESKKELLLMVLDESEGMIALQELFQETQHLRVSYADAKAHHNRKASLVDELADEITASSVQQVQHKSSIINSLKRRVSTKEPTHFEERGDNNPNPPPPLPPPTKNDNLDPPLERLKHLLTRPENLVCADCSAHRPTWGSTNLGVFLCTQCAGVHRSLGVHISMMLSTRLDDWNHEQLDTMDLLGNTRANER